MTASRRVLIGLPLLALLAFIAISTGRWGLASLDTWRAGEILKRLFEPGVDEASVPVLLERGFSHLDNAQALSGPDPDIHDKRGQLYYWSALKTADVGLSRNRLLEQATEQYRLSLAMRPMWPYTWANLVVAKAEWGVFDSEFRRAVRRTVETGPWEPRVQLQLLRVDFLEQERLDRHSRARIDSMLDRALQVQPEAVLRLAARLNQLPRVCGKLSDPDAAPACKRLKARDGV